MSRNHTANSLWAQELATSPASIKTRRNLIRQSKYRDVLRCHLGILVWNRQMSCGKSVRRHCPCNANLEIDPLMNEESDTASVLDQQHILQHCHYTHEWRQALLQLMSPEQLTSLLHSWHSHSTANLKKEIESKATILLPITIIRDSLYAGVNPPRSDRQREVTRMI
jgi:hypothetical protein